MHDYHIHSSFSSDCKVPMEETVKKAIEKKMCEICFTDHIEYDPPKERDVLFKIFDVKEYMQEIARLRGIYGEKVGIQAGVEIGYQPHILTEMKDFLASANFDFVICSVHTVDKLDIHMGTFAAGKTVDEAYARYFEEYYRCVKENLNYSVLGHFDLLKRHVVADGSKVLKDNFDVIEATFKHIIQQGKGLEVNTSGFQYKLGHALPSKDILSLYKELGGEIITIGSDSHLSSTLGREFAYAYDLLREIGFKYVTRFEQMEPKFVKI